jgi:rhamnose utilization protein RhaD (predicted bifunctional aldolase and dehydrogenase)/NAD(P)-dependent dehydrogenase (short-subunit alcohol dehydrogenase family)
MISRWNEEEARRAVARYAQQDVGEDVALRTYSARLLGGDPTLVLHGGGNTSVKTRAVDVYGGEIDVLCVKGSGWDLATIEPAGHPAVRLDPLLRLRRLDRLDDEAMVNAQRANLLDANAPNPSVETLLHAFLPAKFIDHTHATAVLALADQPAAEAIFAELYDGRLANVPYVMPGFALARLAAEIRDANPDVEGLVLLQHGIFTWGATARESYERMIARVDQAERYLAQRGRPRVAVAVPRLDAAAILPRLRGALLRAGTRAQWVLDLRETGAAREVADHPALAELAQRGVATPDHILRTKRAPLPLAAPADSDLDRWTREVVEPGLATYARDYEAYFRRNDARVGGGKKMLDPRPRVLAVPGLGLVAVGARAAEAAITGDIAEAWAATLLAAESVGRYEPVGEADSFDLEYWSLEQAKLGKAAKKRLEGQVVLITGAAGAIGAATARAFAAEGAELVVLDRDKAALDVLPGLKLPCDVTDVEQVRHCFNRAAQRFGGVDIVVSNAGSATGGAMASLDDAALRASFELNFFAHQTVARQAVQLLRAQGTGGCLLFNVSKQAINPGPDFGAYGTAKAALLALMRQYALEHGRDGIRVNAVNPDRIRSGLLTDAMIEQRAKARGVDPNAYMSGNLLGEEVRAEDVAQAFVVSALLPRTTGNVLTVDGGNVAAMLR